LDLLEAAGQPLTRQLIEATLVHVYGVRPEQLTHVLKTLRDDEDGHVRWHAFPVSNHARPTDVYSWDRNPTAAEREAITSLLERQATFFDGHTQSYGPLAETYVFGCLWLSGRYAMPAKSRLGKFWNAEGTRKADIIVADRRNGLRVVVSVRNTREVCYPHHKHIREMESARSDFDAEGVLFVGSFISAQAKSRLDQYGVTHHELQRQLIPMETRDGDLTSLTVASLCSVLGPQPFERIPSSGRFPRPGARSSAIDRDLRSLRAMNFGVFGLGHSSIAVTLDTYSHAIPSLGREAADLFDRAASADCSRS
jgi:hypothetical protein